VRPEFFEFRLKELRLLVCDGFLVEDKHIRDIVRVNLSKLARFVITRLRTNLLLEVYENLRSLPLDKVQLPH
jgi:hypothetical protein